MSHFTVVVRLGAHLEESQLGEELAKALLPYKEAGCGSEDTEGLKEYLVFDDTEEERVSEYSTEKIELVELASGERLFRSDSRFRSWNTSGLGHTRSYPDDSKLITVPLSEHFESLEAYALDYCGEERDPERGRYGHWRNPNQQWDWYQVGGRWSGFFPVKGDSTPPGPHGLFASGVDFLRAERVDWVAADELMHAAADKWLSEYTEFAGGRDDWGPFSGPRHRALKLGFVRCMSEDELTDKDRGEGYTIKPWPNKALRRCDVIQSPESVDLAKVIEAFDPLAPYAYLDSEGWHAPGEMGWWGISNDDPDSYLKFKREFRGRVRSGNQADWLLLVDCHI